MSVFVLRCSEYIYMWCDITSLLQVEMFSVYLRDVISRVCYKLRCSQYIYIWCDISEFVTSWDVLSIYLRDVISRSLLQVGMYWVNQTLRCEYRIYIPWCDVTEFVPNQRVLNRSTRTWHQWVSALSFMSKSVRPALWWRCCLVNKHRRYILVLRHRYKLAHTCHSLFPLVGRIMNTGQTPGTQITFSFHKE